MKLIAHISHIHMRNLADVNKNRCKIHCTSMEELWCGRIIFGAQYWTSNNSSNDIRPLETRFFYLLESDIFANYESYYWNKKKSKHYPNQGRVNQLKQIINMQIFIQKSSSRNVIFFLKQNKHDVSITLYGSVLYFSFHTKLINKNFYITCSWSLR